MMNLCSFRWCESIGDEWRKFGNYMIMQLFKNYSILVYIYIWVVFTEEISYYFQH